MPTVKDIIDLAESQVGTTEYPPNSNDVVYNTAYYGKEVSGSAYPWCCTFVWWVFNQFNPCLVKKTASCMDMAQCFKDSGQWHASPKVGDVVFFKFNTNNRWTNHVGIVKDVIDDGMKIITIEGNTSQTSDDNGGAVMERTRSSNIVGYGRPAYDEEVESEPESNYTHGIDVSKYQGNIDWKAVKESGISFACLRALQGRTDRQIDPSFETNLAGCIENGIDYSCYVYAYAQTHDKARQEADLVINLLKDRKMPIWYDLEDITIASLGKDAIEGIALSFIGELKDAGHEIGGIYCNKTWYENYISDYLKNKFKFWIARYPKDDKGQIREDLKPAWKNVIAWQYSSKGRVDGINGNVDMDVLF